MGVMVIEVTKMPGAVKFTEAFGQDVERGQFVLAELVGHLRNRIPPRIMPVTTLLPMRRPKDLRPALTLGERRDFDRAERKIATGLRSFLEVGLALKEIRDKRLYRQEYDTFEQYCADRWDFTKASRFQFGTLKKGQNIKYLR